MFAWLIPIRIYTSERKVTQQLVELLGLVAISIMVISYALERYSSFFIATFALGCVLAAVYAYHLGSYPFLIAESIWAAIAFARWRSAVRENHL